MPPPAGPAQRGGPPVLRRDGRGAAAGGAPARHGSRGQAGGGSAYGGIGGNAAKRGGAHGRRTHKVDPANAVERHSPQTSDWPVPPAASGFFSVSAVLPRADRPRGFTRQGVPNGFEACKATSPVVRPTRAHPSQLQSLEGPGAVGSPARPPRPVGTRACERAVRPQTVDRRSALLRRWRASGIIPNVHSCLAFAPVRGVQRPI